MSGPFSPGDRVTVGEREYAVLRLLGRGKGGYSYLAEGPDGPVVLKQIHHEPCDYYAFGDKIGAELFDYERLKAAGIPIPDLLAVDRPAERLVKEYIDGPTIFELVRDGADVTPYLEQVRAMAALAQRAGLNIDYFPTNFVTSGGRLWYIDYECNEYMDRWNFENWGLRYWSRTPEFLEYLNGRQA